MEIEYKLYSIKLPGEVTKQFQYNISLPVLTTENETHWFHFYLLDDNKINELHKAIDELNRDHWKQCIREVNINKLNVCHWRDESTIRFWYLPGEWSIKHIIKNKRLMKPRGFFESKEAFEKREKEIYDIYKDNLFEEILEENSYKMLSSKFLTQPNLYPNFQLQNAPSFPEEVIKKIGFIPKYYVSIKSEIIIHPVTIPHGTLIMIVMSLWFSKYPKQMKWWKVLGYADEEDTSAYKLVDNSIFLKEVFEKCGWYDDYKDLCWSLEMTAPKIRPDLRIYFNKEGGYDSFNYVLKCDMEGKLNQTFISVNEYLKNNIERCFNLLFFAPLLEKKGPTELKRRFDKAKILRTNYL